MTTPASLLTRVRGEYLEMPGLRLTLAQACRLWHMDVQTCTAVLDDLLSQRFLHQTHDGSYIAFPATRPTPAKATLMSSRSSTGTQGRA